MSVHNQPTRLWTASYNNPHGTRSQRGVPANSSRTLVRSTGRTVRLRLGWYRITGVLVVAPSREPFKAPTPSPGRGRFLDRNLTGVRSAPPSRGGCSWSGLPSLNLVADVPVLALAPAPAPAPTPAPAGGAPWYTTNVSRLPLVASVRTVLFGACFSAGCAWTTTRRRAEDMQRQNGVNIISTLTGTQRARETYPSRSGSRKHRSP